jgi:maltooligosyltrehalose trehalohydrolase
LVLYRALAQLRRIRPELTDPRFSHNSVEFDENARWLVLRRGAVSIVVNLGDEPAVVACSGAILLVTDAGVAVEEATVTMPAHSAAILESGRCGCRKARRQAKGKRPSCRFGAA